jgi:hypothetical protein
MGCAHHFRPTYPDFLHGAPPTPACAAFVKESRMKFGNASKLDRKSGVRRGERGAPVDSLRHCLEDEPGGEGELVVVGVELGGGNLHACAEGYTRAALRIVGT